MRDDVLTAGHPAGRTQAVTGMAWLGAAQAAKLVLTFVSVVAMSRLLSPDDFGLVAAVGPVIGFASLFQDLGLAQATTVRAEVTRKDADALFWLSAAAGLASSLLLLAFAPLAAWFYGRPELAALTMAFSALPLLGSLQSQHAALLARAGKFREIAGVEAVSSAAGVSAGIGTALWIGNYWAAWSATMAGTVVSLACYWALLRWLPGPPRLGAGVLRSLRFGTGMSVFGMLNFVTRNADSVLIGRFLGSRALGIYDRAFRLLMFPIQQTSAPVGRVMVPALSRLRSDAARYRAAYFEAAGIIMLAAQPGILVAIVGSDAVIRLLLGPSWAEAADVFFWLGLCGLHQVFTSTIGWLVLSQERGRDAALIAGITCATSVPAFAAGLPWGIEGVAAVYALSDFARMIAIWWLAGRAGPVSFGVILRETMPHAVATAAAALALCSLRPLSGAVELLEAWLAAQAVYTVALAAFPEKRTRLWGLASWLAAAVSARARSAVRPARTPTP